MKYDPINDIISFFVGEESDEYILNVVMVLWKETILSMRSLEIVKY